MNVTTGTIAGIILTATLTATTALSPVAEAHDTQCTASSIEGTWLTQTKDAKIQIYAQDGKYFGKIVWLQKPNGPNGSPILDDKNPEEKLRSRPVLSLVNVTGLKYDGGCKWGDGHIYDPKVGKTYDAHAMLDGNGSILDLRGYIGISLFGRTAVWYRVTP